jgi:hypothetical protein
VQLEVHSTSGYFSSRNLQCVVRDQPKGSMQLPYCNEERGIWKCLIDCTSDRDIWKCPRVSVGLHDGHFMWDCIHSCVSLQILFQSDVMC